MEQLLKGKTAIITGASSGIGKSTAILLAKNGANIVVADIDEKPSWINLEGWILPSTMPVLAERVH